MIPCVIVFYYSIDSCTTLATICVLMSNFTLLRCCAGPPTTACRAYADPLDPH